jgi:tetratricopeptide (TPR) repeat protein
LAQKVKGDLDWIVMKAMEKDRQRRYETANGLAMDVRRYLDHEPVSAGPPGRGYRLQKLVRRNKSAFAAGALVLLTLLAGFGTSTGLWLREKEARHEAARLRDESERARANEAELRRRSEIRETITRAAVEVRNYNIAAAEELLAQIPASSMLPSLEAANTYRELGEWYVRESRWPHVAKCYTALVDSLTTVDASDSTSVSRDMLPAASALCEAGAFAEYDRLRALAIKRFRATKHPVVAEQVIKASLLLPASSQLLAALEPLAGMVAEEVKKYDEHPEGEKDWLISKVAWHSLALALYYYRAGDFDAAEKWASRCLAYPNENHPRAAAARLVRSMALHRLLMADEARVEFRAACDGIGARATGNLVIQGGGVEGYWFDWVNSRILLREARTLMGE